MAAAFAAYCRSPCQLRSKRGACANLFDMMAGASVGGIIATGLAHRVCAKAIYVMLTRDGGAIFAKTLLTNVLNALEPKYDAAPLETFLARALGSAMLDGIAKPKLIVPTVDLKRPVSIFFKDMARPEEPIL